MGKRLFQCAQRSSHKQQHVLRRAGSGASACSTLTNNLLAAFMVIRYENVDRIQTIDSKLERLAQELEDAKEAVTFWQDQLDDPATYASDAREAEVQRRLEKAEKQLARVEKSFGKRLDRLQHRLNDAVVHLALAGQA